MRKSVATLIFMIIFITYISGEATAWNAYRIDVIGGSWVVRPCDDLTGNPNCCCGGCHGMTLTSFYFPTLPNGDYYYNYTYPIPIDATTRCYGKWTFNITFSVEENGTYGIHLPKWGGDFPIRECRS